MSDNFQDGGAPAMVGDAFPKASIGNYKGVMLCNRPNENGMVKRPEPSGPIPFKSRVDPKSQNPVGWNPCEKIYPKSNKRPNIFKGILNRHKQFLANLEAQKKFEREDMLFKVEQEEAKVHKFKQNAQKQRTKIKEMKENQELLAEDEQMEFDQQVEQALQPAAAPSQKLSAEALSNLEKKSQQKSEKAPSAVSSKKSKGAKPAWAKTEKQQEEDKEAEIDDLLEFAYDLDYDKYMDDFEVRQAFAIIHDRVKEIKQDLDWKQKIADEWNEAADQEGAVANQGEGAQPVEPQPDKRSVYSYKSNMSRRTAASGASFKKRVEAEKKAQGEKVEWDKSTVASEKKQQLTAEDKVAARIANEVLKDNQKLRGVHSNQSIKKILEKEAKRQLLAETGGVYNPPVMVKVQERGAVNKADPSNLPYLHKCPAV